MAKFEALLPEDILKDFKKLYTDSENIFGEMTKAGADVVADAVRQNVPPSLAPFVKVSRTYRTPTDGGINTKVYLAGYLPFSDPSRMSFSRRGRAGGKVYTTTKGVPVEFIANLYEYGRSTAPFPKHPFLRKSFANKGRIEDAMKKAQKEASGGILDE